MQSYATDQSALLPGETDESVGMYITKKCIFNKYFNSFLKQIQHSYS